MPETIINTKKRTHSESLAQNLSNFAGSNFAFSIALFIVIVWLAGGLIFRFSDTWLLVINTFTTVITFLMVFLIQRAQNKESLALQLKMNEIVASQEGAGNYMINAQDMTEDELKKLYEMHNKMALQAKQLFDSRATITTAKAVKTPKPPPPQDDNTHKILLSNQDE